MGLLLAALLVPLALVLTTAAPANAETCFAGIGREGLHRGTIRTEVDVVPGVDVTSTGPGGFDETATSDERGKWSVTVTEPGDYTATIDEETLARRHRRRPAARARQELPITNLAQSKAVHLRRPHRRLQRRR